MDLDRWLGVDTGGVDLGGLAQYGVLGVIAGLLILYAVRTNKMQTDRAEAAWRREVERADRLETENQRLNNLIREQVIPALTTTVTVMQETQELLRDVQRERELGWRRAHPGEPT